MNNTQKISIYLSSCILLIHVSLLCIILCEWWYSMFSSTLKHAKSLFVWHLYTVVIRSVSSEVCNILLHFKPIKFGVIILINHIEKPCFVPDSNQWSWNVLSIYHSCFFFSLTTPDYTSIAALYNIAWFSRPRTETTFMQCIIKTSFNFFIKYG